MVSLRRHLFSTNSLILFLDLLEKCWSCVTSTDGVEKYEDFLQILRNMCLLIVWLRHWAWWVISYHRQLPQSHASVIPYRLCQHSVCVFISFLYWEAFTFKPLSEQANRTRFKMTSGVVSRLLKRFDLTLDGQVFWVVIKQYTYRTLVIVSF